MIRSTSVADKAGDVRTKTLIEVIQELDALEQTIEIETSRRIQELSVQSPRLHDECSMSQSHKWSKKYAAKPLMKLAMRVPYRYVPRNSHLPHYMGGPPRQPPGDRMQNGLMQSDGRAASDRRRRSRPSTAPYTVVRLKNADSRVVASG